MLANAITEAWHERVYLRAGLELNGKESEVPVESRVSGGNVSLMNRIRQHCIPCGYGAMIDQLANCTWF